MDGKGVVFLGIGFELIALCIGGYVLGQYADDYFGYKNVISTYLVLILLISWFIHLIYLLQRFEADDDPPPPDRTL